MDNEVKTELRKEIISWVKTIVCAVIFAACINNFVIVNANVPTPSMENTIMVDDRIVAFRLAYLLEGPKRYDVVVFRYPDDETKLYVKRVVGLPGETLEIIEGKVYIDGSETPLDDSFLKEPPARMHYGPVTIPEGSYFMMGDNRNRSEDSRAWVNTFVAKEKILGKVIFKYYPGFKLMD
jgi:signal peptidase I